MPVFAFLYRPTRSLNADELTDRTQRIREWVLARREAGQVLAVSVFDKASSLLRHDQDEAEDEASSLAGCTLVNAADLPEALALAQAFPGRHFGTDIEVRPVITFLPPPAAVTAQ
ncbi:MAG: hypothetical protein JF607_24870 [Burkholderiales bacterium]|nr:hypothetical protein [Burkholderiales bacterium]MBW8893016.1 hypothetical protein [Burkholderiales bacterium]